MPYENHCQCRGKFCAHSQATSLRKDQVIKFKNVILKDKFQEVQKKDKLWVVLKDFQECYYGLVVTYVGVEALNVQGNEICINWYSLIA